MLAKIKFRFFTKDYSGKEAEWESGTLLGFATIKQKHLAFNDINVVMTHYMNVPNKENDVIMAMVALDSDGSIVSIPHHYCKLNDEEG